MIRLDDFREQANDAGRCVELSAFAALGASELAEKIFVDTSERVVVYGGRNFGNLLEQFLEQRAGKEVVSLRQDASELRVMLLDVPHSGVNLSADVLRLGALQQIVESRLTRKVENALRVIGGRFVQPAAAPGGTADLLELGALGGEAHIGEA